MKNTVLEVSLSKIKPSWTSLRPVREDSIEFLELTDSLKSHGVLNTILVRPHPTQEGNFEVIDGMWRFTACKSIDMQDIPCIIKAGVLTDEEFLAIQIQANAVTYETRPVEFAAQMERILQIREEVGSPMTIVELAKVVGKSSNWVSSRLKLLLLCDEAKKMIGDNTLTLGKGVALSRIRLHRYQREFLSKAPELTTREFELEVGKFISFKRQEKMAGRREERDEIKLRPRLQTMDSLLIELDRLENISQIIVQKGLTSAREGAKIALEWVLHLHEAGRTEQVQELRHKLSANQRHEILGRQRYEELSEIRELRSAESR